MDASRAWGWNTVHLRALAVAPRRRCAQTTE
jgi:hypothetical protein